jgi:hypothetical protein
VFVVGAPRSGTTLVQQLLAPTVAIPPETHFVRRYWQHRSRFGDLDQPAGWSRLLRAISASFEFSDAGLTAADLESATRTYPGVLQAWLEAYADRRGGSVAGEKTPNHLLAMDLLSTWYPDARFLHVIRDPRAVVLSARATPWTTGSFAGDAEVWRRYLVAARTASTAATDRYAEIRYEELVTEPEPVMRRVCAFLGVEFAAGMLDTTAARPGFNADREPWKAAAIRPLSSAPRLRWEDRLTGHRLAAVEAVTAREMVRWGYQPATAAWRRMGAGLMGLPIRLALSAGHRRRLRLIEP